MKISVHVKPGSRSNEVSLQDGVYLVKLRAQPENGKANAALICTLADHFDVKKSQVRISSGAGSRKKIVEIENLQVDELGDRGPEGT